MNYVHGQYIVEDLFQSARSAGAPHVTIDVLSGLVEPEAVRTVRVVSSVESLQGWLRRWATIEGCDPDVVRAFVIGPMTPAL